MDIILLGDPAAGKATQAALLLKKYKLIDFDMGEELRKIQRGKGNAAIKARLQRTYDKGKLTPTDIVRKILHDRIFSAPKNKGILFDGHPKMIGEARLAAKWLKQLKRNEVIVIYIGISEAEIMRRMRNRVEYFKGKFSKRTDDNPAAMRRRIKYFRSGIEQVLGFYKKNYPFKKISGMGGRTAVHKNIVKILNEFKAN